MNRAALVTRFWLKVNVRDWDECWPWLAGVFQATGYGQFRFEGKGTTAHRVAYILTFGPPLPDADLDHDDGCKRICCNPFHLTERNKSDHGKRHNPPQEMCKQGHPFTPENTIIYKDGSRRCRICENAWQRNRTNPEEKPSNAAKTHCPMGHPYTSANTYLIKRKNRGTIERRCRICERQRQNKKEEA